MSFPQSPTLDRFNRPDAANLGDNYSIVSGYEGLPVVSLNCGLENDAGYQVWSRQRFPINQQVWAVIEDEFISPKTLWLSLRCDSPQPTSGYRCQIVQESGTLIARLYLISTGEEVGSPVSLGIATFADGDLVGVDAVGYRFTLYYRPVGGSSLGMGQWYDTGAAQQGYIGLGAQEPGEWWLGPWSPPYNAVPVIDESDVLVVYQPRWADGTIYERDDIASEANALLNLNNPGIGDALNPVVGGVGQIGWSAALGWIANDGARIELIYAPLTNDETLLASHTAITPNNVNAPIFSAWQIGPSSQTEYSIGGGGVTFSQISSGIGLSGTFSTGVGGVSSGDGYFNGVYILTPTPVGPGPSNVLWLFAQEILGETIATGSVSAFVWYRPAITVAQVAAVSAAMEVVRNG